MMPRMTKKTRMFTLPPTFSSITANIVSTDSRGWNPVKSIAPEKMPTMRDM